MKTKKKRWKIIAKTNSVFMVMSLLALSLAILATWTMSTAWAKDKHVIVFGHLPHFTGAYGATQAGYAVAQEDAVEWANKVNYIPGVELKLIWVDGGTDPAKSLAGFKKMVANKPRPVLIIGESTGIGTAMKKWHEREKVPDVEGGFSITMIDPPSWTFCQTPPYPSQGGAWVDYYLKHIWKKKEPPKFAWLTWDNPYGRAPMTDEAKAYIKSKGIETVATEFIPGVPSNTAAQVMRLKDTGADFTLGGMYPSALSVVLKDMEKLGMTGKITIGMTYATNLEELIDMAGPLANGIHITGIHPLTTKWNEKCPMVLEMYEKKKRDVNKWIYANCWSKFAIAIEAVRMAVKDVGPEKVDGQAIYNALTRMKGFDAWGISTPITYSETDRVGMDSVEIQTVENGKVISKGFAPMPDLLPGGKDVPK